MEERGMIMRRKSKGRQKIEIKKIEKKSRRQVTFSKRRAGLFKKADEIAALTGAQFGILVRSPGNRLFTYGSSDIDTVIDRWLFGNNNTTIACDTTSGEGKERFWWEEPVPENSGLEELEGYLSALENLKNNVSRKVEKLPRPVSVFNDEGEKPVVDRRLDLIKEGESFCDDSPDFPSVPVSVFDGEAETPVVDDRWLDLINEGEGFCDDSQDFPSVALDHDHHQEPGFETFQFDFGEGSMMLGF